MKNSLSIRAYTKQLQSHTHEDYHQLVLPLQGSIEITMPHYSGKVVVGDCVVICAGRQHAFKADEEARFIVADLLSLPVHLYESETPVFRITPPLQSFLSFVEKQLEFQVDSGIEASILDVFSMLLTQQALRQVVEPRIRTVQSYIVEHLDQPLTIELLANRACLSPTQFKKRFKESVGESALQYITALRMEKAKALLTHTDLPIQRVAEQVGYSDLSAFSRRFSRHFGLSPRAFCRA
ncbi:helix-turn-helix domain-containing protein [Vibrio vulnificus]|uniref:helix-turn-helix domain-containing protein n=1 Tax=Vibrio vulnificus TaxID=672 RepID=UPI001CDB61DF|nr:AraC family transcriptional regulator [Vibrio vulnificus]MCA3958690.1 helix-turn-helix domain-containing protein [Vibrio vulnificus]HDY7764911.1 helix-turn-helix domain-containing protein [Vibrio vulnificus]HDY7783264.1 helix-turn-helix domain-containing protein [Vibrio vulnificus]HDY7792176.1 helix-turn-helix domain-containing protein [Vibrio vulnificus]HDY7797109.1 helix-turn-helix domain-containing protein [Vibrio vulnificus]